MAEVSDPAIQEAYDEVRNDSTDIDWAIFTYAEGSNKEIIFQEQGSGGIDEMRGHLTEDQVAYCYIRYQIGSEDEVRNKFVLMSWCGENVKPLARARVSVHKAFVKEVCREYAVEHHATNLDEVDEEGIAAMVVKAAGASYGSGL